jgi:hypothetical protein
MYKAILSILLGLFAVCILLEIIFRVLPVSDRLETLPVNEANPIFRYAPNRLFRISIGQYFQIRTVKRTNKSGFFSDMDFVADTACRKIAFIGDSFVEALQVANPQSVHARLNALLPPGHCVYGIGSSGSALSQYVAYARYAVEAFDPEALVFLIYANDFEQSVLGYDDRPGHHFYDSTFRLVRKDYTPSRLRDLASHSAFIRYLYLHLKLLAPQRRRSPQAAGTDSAAQIRLDDRIRMSKAVTEHFLRDVRAIAGQRTVYLLIDGIRPGLYRDRDTVASPKGFVPTMYGYLARRAGEEGFTAVDLDPVFRAHYAVHRQRFEFPTDGHWNALGHAVAATALASAMEKNRVRQVKN